MDKTNSNILKIIIIAIIIAGSIVTSFIFLQEDYSNDKPLEDLGLAPNFYLTDENNQFVSLSNYTNVILVLDFIFINCPTYQMCPLSTFKMKQVQDELLNRGYTAEDFHLLTISFDWVHDNPTRMKQYGEDHGADPTVWSFLSGTEEQINNTIAAYHIIVFYNSTGSVLSHTMLLTLIDASSRIRATHLTTIMSGWSVELVIEQVIQLIQES